MEVLSPRKSRSLLAWALYDWAGAPFTTLILSFVFPAYFAEAICRSAVRGQALWGYTAALSAVAVGLTSPVIGAIADAQGRNKCWLFAFSSLCAIASFLLWNVQPTRAYVTLALVLFGLANFGYASAVALNNSMLPALVTPDQTGRWSGWSWSLGYAGGLAGLVIVLLCFVDARWFPREHAENIRLTGPFVALWFAAFGWPRFAWTPDRSHTGLSYSASLRRGILNLRITLSQLHHRKRLLRFLLANMLYTDALVAIFALGGIYAAGAFKMPLSEVVKFAIALNVAAGLGAFAFSWIDGWIGSFKTILVSLVGFIVSALGAILTHDISLFWIAGCALGVFAGPVQSSSRSLMARLAPVGQETEYFGLFALSGRTTAFLGPLIVGAVTSLTHSQRLGLASLLLLLAAGLVVLLGVGEPATPAGRP